MGATARFSGSHATRSWAYLGYARAAANMYAAMYAAYVYAQQQGLANRIGNFFSGNPNSQQQVYIAAQQKIQTAARQSPLLTEAQKNTQSMLTGMLRSLGFQQVTVNFG